MYKRNKTFILRLLTYYHLKYFIPFYSIPPETAGEILTVELDDDSIRPKRGLSFAQLCVGHVYFVLIGRGFESGRDTNGGARRCSRVGS